jgi:hypothetical protein
MVQTMIVSLLFLILCFLVFGPLGLIFGLAIVFVFAILSISGNLLVDILKLFFLLCGELEILLIRLIELVRVSIKNTLFGAWWLMKKLAFMTTFNQGRLGLLTLGMLGVVFYARFLQ